MIWNSLENTVEEALALPEGTLVANLFGGLVQCSVDPDELLDVAQEIKEKQIPIFAATQAGLFVKAQKAGLLPGWKGELSIG